jgi:hypothetical protein
MSLLCVLAACPWWVTMLCAHAAYLCYVFLLYIHASWTSCMNMLNVHAASPCCVSIRVLIFFYLFLEFQWNQVDKCCIPSTVKVCKMAKNYFHSSDFMRKEPAPAPVGHSLYNGKKKFHNGDLMVIERSRILRRNVEVKNINFPWLKLYQKNLWTKRCLKMTFSLFLLENTLKN